MQQKILNFIKYNNAFTIVLMVFFLGFGVSFAANPDARESVYASEQTVVSIDNSSVVSADLDNFNFNLRISAITEDEKNYYAAYSYQTLAIEDGFWQNKTIEKTLTVSKEALDGRDLGLFVAKELGENINYELSYLKRVQKLEKEKGESQKMVTTEYSGLIGKLLDPKEKVIEGYVPVISEPVPEVPATVESNPEEVIVSTPYIQPPQDVPADEAKPEEEPPAAPVSQPPPEPAPAAEGTEATSTPIQEEPIEEPAPAPLPEPEDMVDEELIQEVVEELKQEPVPAPEPESTPAPEPENPPEPTP